MGGDRTKCNQSPHFQYHQERGHTTEDCRKLKQFIYQPNRQGSQARLGARRDASIRPPLGTINVIIATPGRTGSRPPRVLSIAQPFIEDLPPDSKRSRVEV